MPDVFVSYSRKDLEFVRRLVDALKKAGKEPWFDQLKKPLSGVVAGAPWWKQIQDGIESVDNFLYIISANSIQSTYCHAEINYAREYGKRLVPVLYCGAIGEAETRTAIDAAIEAIPDNKIVPDSVTSSTLNLKNLVRANWLTISEIQYVVFSSSIPFEQSLEQLIQALNLDLAWVKMHSQLTQGTKLWEASSFDNDFLWGANRLKPVYEMIERRKPELDPLVRDFIKPEQEHLLAELEDIDTTHQRRSAIGERLAAIGEKRQGVGLRVDGLPDILWLAVSPGKVELRDNWSGDNLGEFDVLPFYIAQYPITHIQFQAFLDAPDGFGNDEWWQVMIGKYRKQKMNQQRNTFVNHPRDSVSWYQAVAFCNWLTAKLPREAWPSNENWIIRLPTEWEWQLAATGGRKDYRYPWGKEWDGRRANTSESGLARTTAVGVYPQGISPYNALDMSGSIFEWCLNEFDNPENIQLGSIARRTLRGGSYNELPASACSDYRGFYRPYSAREFFGFRVVSGTSSLP